MIRDLRTILDGWEYEPGKISVRKIIGHDGREKIQTRIDLGLLQLECHGRPDGRRPHGHESLLEHHHQRLREHIEVCGDDEEFVLTPDECRDLRHEAYLYYQRYLSLFVLEEYDGVERDTARNLRVIDLCERYAGAEHDRAMLRPQRAYVVMMNTRARAYLAQADGRTDDALRAIDLAVAQLEELGHADSADPNCAEIETLRALRRELLDDLPAEAPARLRAELELALMLEDYERAAQLRDRLKQVDAVSQAG
jgi:hypothetical protein